MPKPVIVVLLAFAHAGTLLEAQGHAPALVRRTALARIERAQAIAADERIQGFVLARNAVPELPREVRQKDKAWAENSQDPLRRELVANACADRLRELSRDDALVVEVILMDARGALVCASRATSDYWQGDEAKFQETFGAGKDVFVEEPAYDVSTETYGIQLSVIVAQGQTKLGALTLTLRIPREEAQGSAK